MKPYTMEARRLRTFVDCILVIPILLVAAAAYRPANASALMEIQSASVGVVIAGSSSAQLVLADDTLAAVIAAEDAAMTLHPSLDIDVSITATKYDALTDGLLAIRYLFGLTGASLTSSALGGTAWRTDPAEIDAYLDGIGPTLDVDGNGQADALTDGLMFLRYLFGLRGSALTAGAIGAGATRTTAPQIEEYMQSVMP